MRMKFLSDRLFYLLIIMIGIAYLIYQYNFTLLGDDLTFTKRWLEVEEECGLLAYPTFFYRHWIWSNARLADKINPLFFGVLPKDVMYVANSIMIIALLLITIRLSQLKSENLFGRVLMLLLIVFTLPWWDSLMLNVCWFNYVWSAVFGLSVVLLFLKIEQKESVGLWLKSVLFVYVVFSVGMHEASGVSLFAGLISYVFIVKGWKNIGSNQKLILIAVFIGMLYVVSSPASWSRMSVVDEISNKRDWVEILLSSNFYLCLMLIILTLILIKKKNCRILKKMLFSPWIIFVIAAIVSSIFSVISGIIGRTGFFSQIYSLIAIFYLSDKYEIELKRWLRDALTYLFSAVIIFHYLLVVYYQYQVGKELNMVIEEFVQSSDGVVYCDYTREQMIPKFVLNKVKGVPDSDDVWHLHTISLFYSELSKKLVILPEALRSIEAKDLTGIVKTGCDYVSSERLNTIELMTYEKIPLQRFYGNMIPTGNGYFVEYDNNGKEYIVTPFEKDGGELYLISERYVDWGD